MAKQLSVANIEYAGGKSAKGTKVKLSDGSYLAGVSFVETTVGVDQAAEVLIRYGVAYKVGLSLSHKPSNPCPYYERPDCCVLHLLEFYHT